MTLEGIGVTALLLAGCGLAAYVITTIIVAVLDLAGLVWTPEREERRHRNDGAARLTTTAHRREVWRTL